MSLRFSRCTTRSLATSIALLAALTPVAASAETENSAEVPQPKTADADVRSASFDGTVVLVAFTEDGTSPPPLLVRANSRLMTTDADGRALLALAPGTYSLRVEVRGDPNQAWTINNVVVGESLQTEVLLTLGRGGHHTATLDAPEAAALAPPSPLGSPSADAPMATVTGRVIAAEGGAPIAGARVLIRGGTETVTGADGAFVVEVEPGPLAYSVVHEGFRSVNAEGEALIADESRSLEVKMPPAAIELSAVTVTAPHIEGTLASSVDARKNAGTITEVIGAEEMGRNGDGDAAAALSRVTGITLVGGRYVYVRGLGERYSSTLLNGAQLPSPEP